VTGALPTPHFSSFVHGADGVRLDDPAEALHEASRLYPTIAPGRLEVLLELSRSDELGATVARSSRTHDHRPATQLPDPAELPGSLGDALSRRRSLRADALRPVGIGDLASVLAAAYASETGGRRPVPSAGALYPLELYVIAAAVRGLERGVYHLQPFRFQLSRLSPLSWAALRAALVEPEVVDRAAALVVVTAVFARTRFKYGLRGYRFALLEAGHVVQNALLAATVLGLPALPLGGFYDRRLDEIVGADGLDEATVYALALGGTA
jgi:SagB-type dehydrogenase family enzyme